VFVLCQFTVVERYSSSIYEIINKSAALVNIYTRKYASNYGLVSGSVESGLPRAQTRVGGQKKGK